MQVSAKYAVQQLSALFKQAEITDIVISPGSRNAPLSIQFSADRDFNCYSIVDERSAGFFAMGMAQKKRKAVVVCCTSGSAAVNYYPAVVEAFYQNIPLIVLSADRPECLIDQFDGQTIRQYGVFNQHILSSLQINGDEEIKADQLSDIQQKIQLCLDKQSPIHINLSLDEPLYETSSASPIALPNLSPNTDLEIEPNDLNSFLSAWNKAKSKLILVGMQEKDAYLNSLLKDLSQGSDCILLCENTSNLHHQSFISHIDRLIFSLSEEELEDLRPQLLLTIGQNIISKKIKAFLRKHKPERHFHLDPFWQPDTYFCLTDKLTYTPTSFLKKALPKIASGHDLGYQDKWLKLAEEKKKGHQTYLAQTPYSDLKIMEEILNQVPNGYTIHFGNSSVIRYAQLFDIKDLHQVYCNRGTSGIDGCTSTAIGHAIADQDHTNLLITGDISFFYDANALWNNYIPKNFKIIILNNGGGNIFKIIPGPTQHPDAENLFTTPHQRTAEKFAEMYQLHYLHSSNLDELRVQLDQLWSIEDRACILEVNSINLNNHDYLKAYFRSI